MNSNNQPRANSFLFNVKYEAMFPEMLRTLKEFCPLTYRDLMYDKGLRLRDDGKQGINELVLLTSKEFKMLYGPIKLTYLLIGNNVKLLGIEPFEIFMPGFLKRPKFVYGVPIFNKRDKFKITFLRKMEEKEDGSY